MDYLQLPEIQYELSPKNLGFYQRGFLGKVIYHLRNKKLLYLKSVSLLGLEKYEDLLLNLNPDCVIVDKEIHDLIFVSYKLRIPTTITTTWFNHIGDGLNLPPIRTDIIPGSGLKGSRFNIFLVWMFISLKVKGRILKDKLLFKDYRRKSLLQYAKDNCFPMNKIKQTNLPTLFSYPNSNMLSFNLKELEFPHKGNTEFKYVGPMVSEFRNESISHKEQERLQKIFEIKREFNRKIIFCSLSTLIPGNLIFIKNLIRAVASKSEWILVITLGNKVQKSNFDEVPKNTYLFDWVPQLQILKHTDCNINHGGINSINECIHFKVPMLIYSGGNFDQNGSAARMEYHGLGLTGSIKEDGLDEIKANIQKVVEDPSYKKVMIKYNNEYLRYLDNPLTPLLSKHV
ncbi:glycosyltransferase [Maribacter sp. 2210JD10-5]|uniref:glycosyltransferase n=1 Tax=Maribacter sp. 2210JD10-5 TaxID=3386272 RepID=UPI0039BD01C4